MRLGQSGSVAKESPRAQSVNDGRERFGGLKAIALGIIAVAVVQEKDGPGVQARDGATRDLGRPRACGVPDTERPADGTLPE